MLRCSEGHAGSSDDIRVSSIGAFLQVQRLTHLASSRAGEVMQELREVLRQHEASRVSMRVRRRHVAAPQEPGYASRSVTTLPSGDVAGAQPLTTHVRSVVTASSGGVSMFHALLERNAVLHASCSPCADEVQRPVLPDKQSESDEGSSSEEEDMSGAEHTGAMHGSAQLPPASSAGEQQSNGISPPFLTGFNTYTMLPALKKTLFIWCMLIAVHRAWCFTAGRSRPASLNYLGVCHAARTVARPASKRTAVGLQKPQTGVLDFLEGTRYDACLLLLHHMHLTD